MTARVLKCPEDCWDWISEDQAVELVRQAYRLARHVTYPPAGELWIDPRKAGLKLAPGLRAWSSRDQFETDLVEAFDGFVKSAAHAAGLKGYATLAHRHASYLQTIRFGTADPEVSTTQPVAVA